ncbi:hypothetical protein MSBRW_0046 [Methanosarcina barkeri str. Wiesmoor]|uniref:DUF1828 domain-containing protein n=2 Tax=Methanosarcina barkeri TaxID=2208 RepID=A0A0E3QI01_METBA|nr:DUF1828 domain-containing protein [Methanosarcina barkeri]AKB49299.1 hypothetical protein MSBRW_0046 [Methanosarcina barkeri str. Wiesmoor]
MDLTSLERDIKKRICEDIEIFYEGEERLVIVSPVTFDDGDSLNTVLKEGETGWYFTDEGSTLMHLSYTDLDTSLDRGKRQEIFKQILSIHNMENDGGELKIMVEGEDFGESYFTFIQGLIRIVDLVLFTKKEYVKSMFYEEFRSYLKEKFGTKCNFNYTDKARDPESMYSVDCSIEDENNLIFFFGVLNDDKCRDVTITCLKFREWERDFVSICIFEDQETITRKVFGRLLDEVDKSYSTLSTAKAGLPEYMKKFALSMN